MTLLNSWGFFHKTETTFGDLVLLVVLKRLSYKGLEKMIYDDFFNLNQFRIVFITNELSPYVLYSGERSPLISGML